MTAESRPKPFERQRLEEVIPHDRLTVLSNKLEAFERGDRADHPLLQEAIVVGRRIIATYDRLQWRRQHGPKPDDPAQAASQTRHIMHRPLTAKEAELNFNYAFAWCMETAERVMKTLGEQVAEEDALHIAARSLGAYAKERFITSNLPLVDFFARPHVQALGQEHADDLLAVGTHGLGRAVELYDYRKGFAFSTFAQWHIREQMQKYRRRTERIRRHENTFTALTPTDAFHPFEDSIASPNTPDPENAGIRTVEAGWLQERLGLLDVRARSMLTDRFGIGTDREGVSINSLAKKYRLSETEVERQLGEIINHLQSGEGVYAAPHPLHNQAVLRALSGASYEEVAAFWLNRYLRLRPKTVSRLLQQDWKPISARLSALMVHTDSEPVEITTPEEFEATILEYLATKKDDAPEPPKQIMRMTHWKGVDLEDITIRTGFNLIGARIHIPSEKARQLIAQGAFVWAHELQAELDLSRDALRKRIGDARFYATSPHRTWGKLIPVEVADSLRAAETTRRETQTVSQRSLYQHVGARYPRKWLAGRGADQFDKTAAQEMLEEHREHQEDFAKRTSAREVTRRLDISQTTLVRWTRELGITTTRTPLDAHLVLYSEEDIERLAEHGGTPPEETELSLGEILHSVQYQITRSALLKQIQKLIDEQGVATPIRKGRLGGVKSPHYPDWFVEELNRRYGGK